VGHDGDEHPEAVKYEPGQQEGPPPTLSGAADDDELGSIL
jgi:hypothetical protein